MKLLMKWTGRKVLKGEKDMKEMVASEEVDVA